jgi:hypothetical protein
MNQFGQILSVRADRVDGVIMFLIAKVDGIAKHIDG